MTIYLSVLCILLWLCVVSQKVAPDEFNKVGVGPVMLIMSLWPITVPIATYKIFWQ